jgi:FMN phosphatase YigB (HAD superfamily)
MKTPSPISAVTFDAYKTLLDFQSDSEAELDSILDALGMSHAKVHTTAILATMGDVVNEWLERFIERTRSDFAEYIRLHDIHHAMFVEIERAFASGMDVAKATDMWNRYIARVPLYDDAHSAVEWAATRWPTAIVSDIDTWMLAENPNVKPLPLRGLITSEDELTYKAMSDCTMFQAAAKLLDCAPEGIVHIGDSSADVIGIQRVGGRAVWLNRNGSELGSDVPEPEATITTLAELPAVLAGLESAHSC